MMVGSNLTAGIDVRFYSVFVFYSVSSGFATSSHLPKKPYQQTNKQTNKQKTNSVVLVCKRTIPNERAPLVGKLVPPLADRGSRMVSATNPRGR
jgi:hypothetical protein